MEFQHYTMAVIGGLIVGLAAGRVFRTNGRPVGVRSLHPRSADAAWQVVLLLGLVAGGEALSWLDPAAMPVALAAPIQLMIGAGLLAGFAIRRATEIDERAQSLRRRTI